MCQVLCGWLGSGHASCMCDVSWPAPHAVCCVVAGVSLRQADSAACLAATRCAEGCLLCAPLCAVSAVCHSSSMLWAPIWCSRCGEKVHTRPLAQARSDNTVPVLAVSSTVIVVYLSVVCVGGWANTLLAALPSTQSRVCVAHCFIAPRSICFSACVVTLAQPSPAPFGPASPHASSTSLR